MATSKKSKRPVSRKKSAATSRNKVSKKSVRKTAPKKAAKKAAKKVAPKKAAKRSGKKVAPKKAVKKSAPKKAVKSRASKSASRGTAKKSAPKKQAKKSIPAKKRSVAKKSQPVKKGPVKKSAGKKPPRLSPPKASDDNKKDVKDTLRNLTEDSVAQEPAGHDNDAVAPKDEKKTSYTNTEDISETETEPSPWVEVDDHVAVEDTAISGKEDISEDNNSNEIVNPTEKPFEKFAPRTEAHHKLYLSTKPKGVVKPAGKKPLWNK